MEIFGWIMLITLVFLGLFYISISLFPLVVSELKCIQFKVTEYVKLKKEDILKYLKEYKERLTIKRNKNKELQDLKLDSKLSKLEKKIQNKENKLRTSEYNKDQKMQNKIDKLKKGIQEVEPMISVEEIQVAPNPGVTEVERKATQGSGPVKITKEVIEEGTGDEVELQINQEPKLIIDKEGVSINEKGK